MVIFFQASPDTRRLANLLHRIGFVILRTAYSLQARHATSRNFGTPVAIIHSPTQRMGDALAALVSLSLIYLISYQYIKEHENLWLL